MPINVSTFIGVNTQRTSRLKITSIITSLGPRMRAQHANRYTWPRLSIRLSRPGSMQRGPRATVAV